MGAIVIVNLVVDGVIVAVLAVWDSAWARWRAAGGPDDNPSHPARLDAGRAGRYDPAAPGPLPDLLRALGILGVVAGHSTIAPIAWDHAVIRPASATRRAARLRTATRALQVIPLFVFVGGYAHANPDIIPEPNVPECPAVTRRSRCQSVASTSWH